MTPADFAHFGTRYDLEFAMSLPSSRHAQAKGWTQTNFEIYFNHKNATDTCLGWDERNMPPTRSLPRFGSLLDRAAQLAGPAGARARILNRTDISWSFAQDVTDDQMGPIFDLWVVGAGNFAWTSFGVKAIHGRHQLAWWYGGVGGPERRTMDVDRQAILCWRRSADGFSPPG
jgi:hypothetical protein